MIFPENRLPLFRIMRKRKADDARARRREHHRPVGGGVVERIEAKCAAHFVERERAELDVAGPSTLRRDSSFPIRS